MTDLKPTETQPVQPQASRIGFDNLLEDLFGLNIRALKSIWTSFSKPKTYIQAAHDPNWRDRFTPSFRVWFGLLALYSVLRFIYGAEDSPMVEMYAKMFEDGLATQPENSMRFDTTKTAQEMLKWTFVFFPFALIPFYAVLAWIFRSFPNPTTFVLRLRYIFITVLPTTTLVLLSTFLYLVPVFIEHLLIFSALSFVVIFFVDWLTGYRGAFAGGAKKGRAGLSMVFATLLMVSYISASILAAIPAGVIAVATSVERVETIPETIIPEDMPNQKQSER